MIDFQERGGVNVLLQSTTRGQSRCFSLNIGDLCFPFFHFYMHARGEYKLHKYAAFTHVHYNCTFLASMLFLSSTPRRRLCNATCTYHVAPPTHSSESSAFSSDDSSFKKLSRGKNRRMALPWKEGRHNQVLRSVQLQSVIRSFRPKHHWSYVFEVVQIQDFRCFNKRFRDFIPTFPSPELLRQTQLPPSHRLFVIV